MDFLDMKIGEIEQRLERLQPAVAESGLLEAALERLRKIDGGNGVVRKTPLEQLFGKSSAAPATVTIEQTKPKRPGRPKGGERAKQVLKLLERGSWSAAEIGRDLGMRPNYLYRVLKGLEKDGVIVKDGTLWRLSG